MKIWTKCVEQEENHDSFKARKSGFCADFSFWISTLRHVINLNSSSTNNATETPPDVIPTLHDMYGHVGCILLH